MSSLEHSHPTVQCTLRPYTNLKVGTATPLWSITASSYKHFLWHVLKKKNIIFSFGILPRIKHFLFSRTFFYRYSLDGEPTTVSPPEPLHPEMWISVSSLLLLTTISVLGFVLFLRFRHTPCRLKDPEDHDTTLIKIPTGEDPSYGVRDTGYLFIIETHIFITYLHLFLFL